MALFGSRKKGAKKKKGADLSPEQRAQAGSDIEMTAGESAAVRTEVDEDGNAISDIASAEANSGSSMVGGVNSAVVVGKRRSNVYDFSKMDEVFASKEASTSDDDSGLDVNKLSRKERKALKEAMEGSIAAYPHLVAMKPSEGFVFHSDYFEVDDFFGCVLAFFHDDGAADNFVEFWGINQIPSNLDSRVTAVLFSSVARMPEAWIDRHMKTVDRLDKLEEREQKAGGTMKTRNRSAKISNDMMQVTVELQNGASYLSVHQRLLVKAPSLELLDQSVEKIKRQFVERFGTLNVAAYPGEQRQEMTNLFAANKAKRGKGFHYTSTEFAGNYSLVTNGLNDPHGEYVGYMVGDVNNSAVLFDVDGYIERVVCADSTISTAPALNRPRVVDMWGSKISQAALLNNHKVVHIVLNDAKLDELGPPLNEITSRVDMVSGDINMFEFFGDVEDELSLYSAQVEKITLMAEEAQPPTPHDRSIIRGELSHLLERFYTDAGMWSPNAKENRDRLRLVGLNHDEVPLLHHFYTYLETQYNSIKGQSSNDPEELHAANVLRMLFKAMLENNGDLFDQPTSNSIDGVDSSRRVIYDFANLRMRGQGVAMAQLVNVIGFAVRHLTYGDTLIFHGAERIVETVKDYIHMQTDGLIQRGGRVVYLYNNVEKMIEDADFNGFVKADYTVLGPMTPDVVPAYQQRMAQEIPQDLQQLVTVSGRNQSYLRRKFSNVVFYTDLGLGLSINTQGEDATGATGRGGRAKKVADASNQVSPEVNEKIAQALGQVPESVASSKGSKKDERVTEDGPTEIGFDVEAANRAQRAQDQVEETLESQPDILAQHEKENFDRFLSGHKKDGDIFDTGASRGLTTVAQGNSSGRRSPGRI